MKKPDNVADNPGLLPYASNVGAPAIIPDNINDWKFRGISKVNKQISAKFNELQEEYLKLIEEYKWNELIYQSQFSHEPVIGKTYHLYVGKNKNLFLSLIAPDEWNKEHIGSFKLNSELKWVKI